MNTNDNNLEIATQEDQLQTWSKPGFERMDLRDALTQILSGSGSDIIYS